MGFDMISRGNNRGYIRNFNEELLVDIATTFIVVNNPPKILTINSSLVKQQKQIHDTEELPTLR